MASSAAGSKVLAGDRRAILIHGNTDHGQFFPAVLFLQGDKAGNFRTAGRAPRRPKVQNDHLAFEIQGLEHLALDGSKFPTWGRRRFGGRIGGAFGCTVAQEQRQGLQGLLSSINAVALFRGGAGTGKSFVLRELAEEVRTGGQEVVVLAPQRQQVVEMEQVGFPMPITFSSFLLKRELAQKAVVVVDEAGQIGGWQMLALLRLVRARNARLILSGDTRQHGAAAASDALLAIERHSGDRPVELGGEFFVAPIHGDLLADRGHLGFG